MVDKIKPGDIALLVYEKPISKRTRDDLLWIDIYATGGNGNEVIEISIKNGDT